MSEDTLLKRYEDDQGWYEIYSSGLLRYGQTIFSTGSETTLTQKLRFADNTYNISVFKIPYYTPCKPYLNKSVVCTKSHNIKYIPQFKNVTQVQNKMAPVYDIIVGYNNSNVCPVNKTAYTQGTSIPKVVSFKGPTKTANVENVSSDPTIGISSAQVNAINVNIGVNQFITLKVDLPGARINNLPMGFTFANGEITGSAKTAGEYKFNIVSEATVVPVILKATNIIRIA